MTTTTSTTITSGTNTARTLQRRRRDCRFECLNLCPQSVGVVEAVNEVLWNSSLAVVGTQKRSKDAAAVNILAATIRVRQHRLFKVVTVLYSEVNQRRIR